MGWCFLIMVGTWRLRLVVVVGNVSHLESAMCFRQKKRKKEKKGEVGGETGGRVKNLGHR